MMGWDFKDIKITLRTHESVTLDLKEQDPGIFITLMYYMYEVTICNRLNQAAKSSSRQVNLPGACGCLKFIEIPEDDLMLHLNAGSRFQLCIFIPLTQGCLLLIKSVHNKL